MKQMILTQFPWPWLPTLALLLFFGFFVGLLIHLNSRSVRSQCTDAATLPLKDGEIHE